MGCVCDEIESFSVPSGSFVRSLSSDGRRETGSVELFISPEREKRENRDLAASASVHPLPARAAAV